MSDCLIIIPKSHKEHGKFKRKQSRKDVIKNIKRELKFFDGPKLKSSKPSKNKS